LNNAGNSLKLNVRIKTRATSRAVAVSVVFAGNSNNNSNLSSNSLHLNGVTPSQVINSNNPNDNRLSPIKIVAIIRQLAEVAVLAAGATINIKKHFFQLQKGPSGPFCFIISHYA
jgi:hypothetical protein